MNLLHNRNISERTRGENEEFNSRWIGERRLLGSEPRKPIDLGVDPIKQESAEAFMVVWLQNIDRLCSMLPAEVKIQDFSLIDVGCGSGISTLYFSENYEFRDLVGFDISTDLIDLALQNKVLRKHILPQAEHISFLVSDAANYKVPDKPLILFLFNPFNAVLLETFIENNLHSLRKSKSLLLYANDLHIEKLSSYGEILARDEHFNLSIVSFGSADGGVKSS